MMKLLYRLLVMLSLAAAPAAAQETTFGGDYAALDARQKRLIQDWVVRFEEVTGQEVEAEPFYDEYLRLSTKTTFDALTHALMTTELTDASGTSLGSALDLIASMETVRGKVTSFEIRVHPLSRDARTAFSRPSTTVVIFSRSVRAR